MRYCLSIPVKNKFTMDVPVVGKPMCESSRWIYTCVLEVKNHSYAVTHPKRYNVVVYEGKRRIETLQYKGDISRGAYGRVYLFTGMFASCAVKIMRGEPERGGIGHADFVDAALSANKGDCAVALTHFFRDGTIQVGLLLRAASSSFKLSMCFFW